MHEKSPVRAKVGGNSQNKFSQTSPMNTFGKSQHVKKVVIKVILSGRTKNNQNSKCFSLGKCYRNEVAWCFHLTTCNIKSIVYYWTLSVWLIPLKMSSLLSFVGFKALYNQLCVLKALLFNFFLNVLPILSTWTSLNEELCMQTCPSGKKLCPSVPWY